MYAVALDESGRFQSGAIDAEVLAACGVWQNAQVLLELSVIPVYLSMSCLEPLIPVWGAKPAYAAPAISPVNAIATVIFFNMVILLCFVFAPVNCAELISMIILSANSLPTLVFYFKFSQ